jgi:hypothetical protein
MRNAGLVVSLKLVRQIEQLDDLILAQIQELQQVLHAGGLHLSLFEGSGFFIRISPETAEFSSIFGTRNQVLLRTHPAL